jgi:hypothetical protein
MKRPVKPILFHHNLGLPFIHLYPTGSEILDPLRYDISRGKLDDDES